MLDGPFAPITISAGILTNLVYDLLKAGVKKGAQSKVFEGTLFGRMLIQAGLREPNFEERFQDVLVKTLTLFFNTHPNYALAGVEHFFRDPTLSKQLCDHLLDGHPLSEAQLQTTFEQQFQGMYATSKYWFQERNLSARQLVDSFLHCYNRVLRDQLSLPQLVVLLDIIEMNQQLKTELQASEQRLKEYIAGLLTTKLSAQAQQTAYQTGQQQITATMVDALQTTKLVQPNEALQTIQKRLQTPPPLFTVGLCHGQLFHAAPDRYFVSHSFPHDTLADWRKTLTDALVHANKSNIDLAPVFAGDAVMSGFHLCSLCEQLYATRFSLFLLPPSQDRNVYLELGVAIGLEAPFFLIQHHEAPLPPILEGLTRYTKGGLFRTMRRELAHQIEEYDFGVVHFVKPAQAVTRQPRYLLAAGELIDDEDVEGSITDVLKAKYNQLEAISLTQQLHSAGTSWMIEQLVETLQSVRFAIYRVDEVCSPATFLALGISIALHLPFLMIQRKGTSVPEDLGGISLYQYPNFVTLENELLSVPAHHTFFEQVMRP